MQNSKVCGTACRSIMKEQPYKLIKGEFSMRYDYFHYTQLDRKFYEEHLKDRIPKYVGLHAEVL